MNGWQIGGWCVLGVLGLMTASAEQRRVEPPRWSSDYETAQAAARRSGKPLFVVFRCEH
jgi:hypothetical protein